MASAKSFAQDITVQKLITRKVIFVQKSEVKNVQKDVKSLVVYMDSIHITLTYCSQKVTRSKITRQ